MKRKNLTNIISIIKKIDKISFEKSKYLESESDADDECDQQIYKKSKKYDTKYYKNETIHLKQILFYNILYPKIFYSKVG